MYLMANPIGVGTILSGLSVFACGRPRLNSKDNVQGSTCCVNTWVGISQLFTVTFMLVGWFWSVVWGIYMIILARKSCVDDVLGFNGTRDVYFQWNTVVTLARSNRRRTELSWQRDHLEFVSFTLTSAICDPSTAPESYVTFTPS